MRQAKFVKALTINLTEELYNQIKQETDKLKISFSEWFRDAVIIKLKSDKHSHMEDQNNE
jgi:hypothetical protein